MGAKPFLALNIALGGKVNFALPVVFMMLGAAFFLLTFAFMRRWKWAAWARQGAQKPR